MARLTREQILAADDLRAEIVDVPEWGGEVRLVALSFGAAAGMFKKEVEGVDPRLRLIAACVVDDDGAPIFSEEDLGELGSKNAEVIARLWKRAVELNGLILKTSPDGEKDSANTEEPADV
jgi:hypothetical protein